MKAELNRDKTYKLNLRLFFTFLTLFLTIGAAKADMSATCTPMPYISPNGNTITPPFIIKVFVTGSEINRDTVSTSFKGTVKHVEIVNAEINLISGKNKFIVNFTGTGPNNYEYDERSYRWSIRKATTAANVWRIDGVMHYDFKIPYTIPSGTTYDKGGQTLRILGDYQCSKLETCPARGCSLM